MLDRNELIIFLVKITSAESVEKTKEEWEEYYSKMTNERLWALAMCHGKNFDK